MDYKEIIDKIDQVLRSIDDVILNLYKKAENYSRPITNDGSLKKYHYSLELNNYKYLKTTNKIRRYELFKKRCQYYKDYLKYIENNDILNLKRNEYNFIKMLQDETIFFFESREKELKQRLLLEDICDKDHDTTLTKLKDLALDRDKKYKVFTNREFALDEDKIYSLEYLNFNVNEVTDISYVSKSRKRAA